MSYKLAKPLNMTSIQIMFQDISEGRGKPFILSEKDAKAERSGRVAKLEKGITRLKEDMPNYDKSTNTYRIDAKLLKKKVLVDVTDLLWVITLLREIVEKDQANENVCGSQKPVISTDAGKESKPLKVTSSECKNCDNYIRLATDGKWYHTDYNEEGVFALHDGDVGCKAAEPTDEGKTK